MEHAELDLVTLQGWTCAWRGKSLVPQPAALAQLSRLPAMPLAQVLPGLLILGGGLASWVGAFTACTVILGKSVSGSDETK